MTDTAAAEVRRLRLTIVALALVVVLALGGWFLYNQASKDGKQKADDKIACLSGPNPRDC